MTRTQRFSPVLRMAETKKRDAARVAAQAGQKLHEYEKKLEELRNFRDEYGLGRFNDGQVMSAGLLQEQQKFMHQLDEGINILKNRVEGQKQSSDIDRRAWLEAYKHSDALDKLMLKMQKVEIQLRESRAENELDAHTQYSRSKS